MGQQPSRDAGRPSGASRRSATMIRAVVDRGVTPPRGIGAPAPSGPAKPTIPSNTRVDGGYVVSQGVYSAAPTYDKQVVRELIVQRRLAPFFPAVDEEEDASECPICFLCFPTQLNRSRCCLQPICTECFVQIQRVDPTHSMPPSSQPAMCPFCVAPEFGVVYDPPQTSDASARPQQKQEAEEAIERAATAIGTGGASAGQRTSYAPDHPRVVLVDEVHPDWQSKLDAALAVQARQANRRVIMRQVGDRLVPIGVSSSRTGESLANAVSQNARLGHNGPGGSIILNEDAHVRDLELDGTSTRTPNALQRGLAARFRSGDRRPQIGDSMARAMLQLSPQEMEQIILNETLRLSLREHEATQRRGPQNDAASTRSGSPTQSRSNRNSPEQRRPRMSLDLSRFTRSSSEQPRTSRISSDTSRSARNSPESQRNVPIPESQARALGPEPQPEPQPPPESEPEPSVPAVERQSVPALNPVPDQAPAPSARSYSVPAAPADRPVAAAPTGAPSFLANYSLAPAATPTQASHPFPTRSYDSSPIPSIAPSSPAPSAPASPFPQALPGGAPRTPTAPSAAAPVTPDQTRPRTASNTPVHLSKTILQDLQELSGAPPAPHTPSTNPFRR